MSDHFRTCSLLLLATILPVAALMVLPLTSHSVMVGLSTEDLTRASETVVTGQVAHVESFWSEDGETILTGATIAVERTIKGPPSTKRITVVYPGGEIDGIGLKVSDVAPLEEREHVLLFLQREKSGKASAAATILGADSVYAIVGKAQGKYTIQRDGTATKKGFTIAGDGSVVDAEIPVEELIHKIVNTK